MKEPTEKSCRSSLLSSWRAETKVKKLSFSTRRSSCRLSSPVSPHEENRHFGFSHLFFSTLGALRHLPSQPRPIAQPGGLDGVRLPGAGTGGQTTAAEGGVKEKGTQEEPKKSHARLFRRWRRSRPRKNPCADRRTGDRKRQLPLSAVLCCLSWLPCPGDSSYSRVR